jgi:hypothetical protein
MEERERRRRAKEERAFSLWTLLTRWEVVGGYLLSRALLLVLAYLQGALP